MSDRPNFGWILLAQSLSAGGELFGQRAGRACHQHSNLRLLLSTVVYSAVQAFVVLLVFELAAPHLTDGQGALGMWAELQRHPGLWINAVNNTVYWIALIYVLREPLGVILVVLAFLLASFFIDPFQQIVGMPPERTLEAGAVVAAILGTLLCITELPAGAADQLLSTAWWRGAVSSPCTALRALVGPAATGAYSRLGTPPQGAAESRGDAHTTVPPSRSSSDEEGGLQPMEVEGSADQLHAVSCAHTLTVAAAFAVLALTAGIGIVVTTYFESKAGLNMFGYAAIDQILLPVTSLPVAWALYQSPTLLRALGEPEAVLEQRQSRENPSGLTFWGVLAQTWRETQWLTLVPFRGLMFAREFVFFYLATAFPNVNAVYLEMTLVRVVLCWVAALLACTYLKEWVGVTAAEAASTLHPLNFALKVVGSVCIVLSILQLTGHL